MKVGKGSWNKGVVGKFGKNGVGKLEPKLESTTKVEKFSIKLETNNEVVKLLEFLGRLQL